MKKNKGKEDDDILKKLNVDSVSFELIDHQNLKE